MAGLEAAWIAAARGHQVDLFGAAPKPGGGALWESRLPGRADIAKAVAFQQARAAESGVTFHLGKPVTVEEIAVLKPDDVILATGATSTWPTSLASGTEALDLRSTSLELLASDTPRNGTAVLFDQDHSAGFYAAAELFAARFDRTIIMTPRPTIGSKVNFISLIGVFRRLAALRIEIVPLSLPLALAAGCLTYRNALNGDEKKISDVACLTYATPRAANDNLLAELVALGLNVQAIGDCRAPRNMAAAIHEGHAAGLSC